MSIIIGLLAQFWPYIVLIGGGLLWGLKQRRAGAASERAKRDAADKRANDISNDVQNDIGALTPEQRRERLRTWARD